MNKLTVRDMDLKGKRVLMRVDFNVPVANGKVTDDTRITAALPTIKYVLDHGASVILMSHLGRPKGKGYEKEFSLKPVADRLSDLIHRPVRFAPDCIGPEVKAMADALGKEQQILLLENLRFHGEEEGKPKVAETATDEEKKAAKSEMKKRQKEFAKQLAALGEVYVNDAFDSAHHVHGSTSVICENFKTNVAGFLMEKEMAGSGGNAGSESVEGGELPGIASLTNK